jgi:hypothetical protein
MGQVMTAAGSPRNDVTNAASDDGANDDGASPSGGDDASPNDDGASPNGGDANAGASDDDASDGPSAPAAAQAWTSLRSTSPHDEAHAAQQVAPVSAARPQRRSRAGSRLHKSPIQLSRPV